MAKCTQGSITFESQPNGDVIIAHLDGTVIEKIDFNHWGSLVLCMTAFSERPNDWHKFIAHHLGEVDILEYVPPQNLA